MSLPHLAEQESPEIQRLRRDFHAHPEISFQESRTSDVVAAYLQDLGLAITRPEGMTGLWADLPCEGATRTLCFRADMDALAMDENETAGKKGFVSQNPGAAHCCGHDSHMAMLLAAARLLATDQAPRSVNLRFLFQHAEELSPGGAIDLIEAGCLEGVDEIYGIHVIPPIPSGLFDVMEGPFMAAADEITIRIQGRGGHAAMPHLLRDPIAASSPVIAALQQIVSRYTSPFQSLVISIASIEGGSGTSNVIPDTCTLHGTVRTLDPALWKEMPALIQERATAAARAAGCEIELDYQRGYPVLVNHPEATAKARQAAVALYGQECLLPQPQALMGGEDFARYLERIPGCYVFLGVGNADKHITAANHHVDFDVDESILPRGTAWFLQLAQGN